MSDVQVSIWMVDHWFYLHLLESSSSFDALDYEMIIVNTDYKIWRQQSKILSLQQNIVLMQYIQYRFYTHMLVVQLL